MDATLTLAPEPDKTLSDYPRITANYTRSADKYLHSDLSEMSRRANNPKSDWDKKFARLHVEAIQAEINLRKKV